MNLRHPAGRYKLADALQMPWWIYHKILIGWGKWDLGIKLLLFWTAVSLTCNTNASLWIHTRMFYLLQSFVQYLSWHLSLIADTVTCTVWDTKHVMTWHPTMNTFSLIPEYSTEFPCCITTAHPVWDSTVGKSVFLHVHNIWQWYTPINLSMLGISSAYLSR